MITLLHGLIENNTSGKLILEGLMQAKHAFNASLEVPKPLVKARLLVHFKKERECGPWPKGRERGANRVRKRERESKEAWPPF